MLLCETEVSSQEPVKGKEVDAQNALFEVETKLLNYTGTLGSCTKDRRPKKIGQISFH